VVEPSTSDHNRIVSSTPSVLLSSNDFVQFVHTLKQRPHLPVNRPVYLERLNRPIHRLVRLLLKCLAEIRLHRRCSATGMTAVGSESVTRGPQFDVLVLQTTRHISQWNPRYRLKQVNIDL